MAHDAERTRTWLVHQTVSQSVSQMTRTKPIAQVDVNGNFNLPKAEGGALSLSVVGFERDLPELAKDGFSFTIEYAADAHTPEQVSWTTKSYLDLLRFLAGMQKAVDGSDQYNPHMRHYAKLAVGTGPSAMEFFMLGPAGNPDFVTLQYKAQCYQKLPPLPGGTPLAYEPLHNTANYAQPFGMQPPPLYPVPQPQPHYTAAPSWPLPGQLQAPAAAVAAQQQLLMPAGPQQLLMPAGPSAPEVKDDAEVSGGASSSGTTLHPSAKRVKLEGLPEGHGKGSSMRRKQSQKSGIHKTMLGTQAQSHSHVFGAIAELIDNSWDQEATLVDVGIEIKLELPILHVKDNGKGMDQEALSRMLDYGHKRNAHDKHKLGKYGVGFKTGSMRIGKDAIVFTRKGSTASIGLLSQTHNDQTEDESLDVPQVTFIMPQMEPDLSIQSEAEATAIQKAIAKVSPFSVLNQGAMLGNLGEHGTAIFIWNLEKRKVKDVEEHAFELRWGPKDIIVASKTKVRRPGNKAKSQPIDWSLRAYLGYLYAGINDQRKFLVKLQGRAVERGQAYFLKSLTKKSKVYKKKFPIFYEDGVEGLDKDAMDTARLVFGFSEKHAKDYNSGVCIYWRHRMITSFDTLDEMNTPDTFGIIGICSVGSILNPTNNKQAFKTNDEVYVELENWIKECVRDYKEKFFGEDIHKKTAADDVEDTWAFCSECGKARRLPPGIDVDDDSDVPWYCWQLPVGNKYRECSIPQEEVFETERTIGVKNAGRTFTAENEPGPSKKQKRG